MEEFFEAVKAGEIEKVSRLLARRPSLCAARDGQGLSAVLVAVYHRQPETARLLVESGAPLDFFEAAAVGSLETVVRLAEEQPARVNAFAPDGFQALGLACFFGHLEVARWLVEHGANVNTPSANPAGVTPLHSAAAGRQLEIARLLLERGAGVDARQAGNFTPLHAAAGNGQAEMVRLLLEYGADPQARSSAGDTPAGLARKGGFDAIAGLLERRA